MLPQSKKNNKNSGEFHKPQVIGLFALVGMSISGIMGIMAYFNQQLLLASILIFASLVYAIGYYAIKKHNNIRLSSSIILYSLYVLMFYLVHSGGVENTGPLWIYIVAPVSVFVHGLKRGLIDIAFFIATITAIMFIPVDIIAYATYSTEFKLRLIYSFLTVTFLAALYEYSRELSYNRTLELSKKYQQLAHFDPLTNLSNRRDAMAILKREKIRMKRTKEPLSVILCDVDHFKKINDNYGHNIGDKVLIKLANLFSKQIREQDGISRWGGEEFLFILPQTSAENAYIIAEKIQLSLQDHLIEHEEQKIKVTISMGIEQLNNNQSIDEAINNADKYLYKAKNAGRNQIFPQKN
jgi:diguanylate cyclase (GGDEF)-like protein